MKKKLIAFGSLLGIILLGIFVYYQRSSNEPVYNGQPISYWIDQSHRGGVAAKGTTEAFAQMGAEAIPYFTAELQRKDSKLDELYRKIYPTFPATLKARCPYPISQMQRRNLAYVRLLNLDVKELTSHLIPLTTHPDPEVRYYAVNMLTVYRFHPPGREVIPIFKKAIEDRGDPRIRRDGLSGLGKFRGECLEFVSVYLDALRDPAPEVRVNAAIRLAICDFGENIYTHTYEGDIIAPDGSRYSPKMPLSTLTTNSSQVIPVLIEAIESSDPNIKHSRGAAINLLSLYGGPAKAAVPALISLLNTPGTGNNSRSQSVQAARMALKRIDPEKAVEVLKDEDVQNR